MSRTLLSYQFSNRETSAMPLKGNNPRRYKLCQQCLGCVTPGCGSCHFCCLFEQQKERITMGKSTCDTILCQNPVALFNSLMGSTRDDEDGCPFKFINGLVGLQIMTLKKLCFVSLFPKTGHSFHQVLIGLKNFSPTHILFTLYKE